MFTFDITRRHVRSYPWPKKSLFIHCTNSPQHNKRTKKSVTIWPLNVLVFHIVFPLFSNVWRLAVTLPDDDVPEYRYCVVVVLRPLVRGDPQHVIVRRWETHILPRRAHSQGMQFCFSKKCQPAYVVHTPFVCSRFSHLQLTLPSHTLSAKSDLGDLGPTRPSRSYTCFPLANRCL